jgi:hypothetical protein
VSATDIFIFGEEEHEGELRRRAISAALEYRVADAWTLSFGGGASIGGDLVVEGVRHRFGPGPVASFAASYQILDGQEELPFLLFGTALSGSTVLSEADPNAAEARFTAIDVRASLTVGKLFLDALAPYATVRGFGGPIFWELNGETVGGTDKYHFQLGAGFLVTAGVVDAFFEIVPLGERAVTVGAAMAF